MTKRFVVYENNTLVRSLGVPCGPVTPIVLTSFRVATYQTERKATILTGHEYMMALRTPPPLFYPTRLMATDPPFLVLKR